MLPRAITRYVIFELLKVFFMTLAAITLFMVVVVGVQEARRQGLGFGPTFRLIPYTLPVAMRVSIPASILLAVCAVFGRMSADNEIVALKSMGISPISILQPSWVLGFAASLFAVFVNDLAVSWGRPGLERVVQESIEQIAYGLLKTGQPFSTANFSLSVAGVEGKQLLRPTLVLHTTDGSPETIVTARIAEMRRNEEQQSLSIVLTDGLVEVGEKGVFAFPDTFVHEIPLADSVQAANSSSPSNLSLRDMSGETSAQRHQLDRLQQEMATRAAYLMLSGNLQELTSPEWELLRLREDQSHTRLERLRSEPWRRWANGFSCLCFTLVGAPVAMRMRNANLFTTFFSCFGPILGTYYPLLAYGVDRAKCGALPPYAVWLGNTVYLLVGILFLRWARRH